LDVATFRDIDRSEAKVIYQQHIRAMFHQHHRSSFIPTRCLGRATKWSQKDDNIIQKCWHLLKQKTPKSFNSEFYSPWRAGGCVPGDLLHSHQRHCQSKPTVRLGPLFLRRNAMLRNHVYHADL
jgi:hypothetical protein